MSISSEKSVIAKSGFIHEITEYNPFVYYDLTTSVGDYGTQFANGDNLTPPNDLSGNFRNGKLISTPVLKGQPVGNKRQGGGLFQDATGAVEVADIADILQDDCEVWFLASIEQTDAHIHKFLHINNTTGTNLLYIGFNEGKVLVDYNGTTGRWLKRTDTLPLTTELPWNSMLIRVIFDFTIDDIRLYIDGAEVVFDNVIGTALPTVIDFGALQPYLGGQNVDGVLDTGQNVDGTNIYKFGVFPLKTDQEASEISQIMLDRTDNKVALNCKLEARNIKEAEILTIGVNLVSQPTNAVTVTPSSIDGNFTVSSALIFSSGNWSTPQKITITAGTEGSSYGYKNDTLRLTLSSTDTVFNGVILDELVRLYDENNSDNFSHSKFYEDIFYNSHTENDSLETIRTALNLQIFGGDKPSTEEDSIIVANDPATAHQIVTANVTGWDSIDKISFITPDPDGFAGTNIAFHFKPTATRNNRLFIDIAGHGATGDHEGLADIVLAKGYDYVYVNLGRVGGSANTSTNPALSGLTNAAYHDALADLDTSSRLFGMEQLFDHMVRTINYMTSNYTINNIYIEGVSGGVDGVLWFGAIDSRIEKVFGVRGLPFRMYRSDLATGDYENCGTGTDLQTFNKDVCSQTDMIALISDQGQMYYTSHINDTVSAWAYGFNWFDGFVKQWNSSGVITDISENPAYVDHEIQQNDLDFIDTHI